MNHRIGPASRSDGVGSVARPAQHRGNWLDRWCRKRVFRVLQSISRGQLLLIESGRTSWFGRKEDPLFCELYIHDSRAYQSILFGGSIGAAEAYADGLWSCSDLPALVQIFLRNQDIMAGVEGGWSSLSSLSHKFRHWLNANSLRGSKKNIAAHYDLGNDFFSLFLDSNLMYSCAYYLTKRSSLEEASEEKCRRIGELLKLQPGDHLLEIGSGWGGFALYAAENFGCRVTTTTISESQFQLAQTRVEEAGLEHRIRVLKQDYRKLTGEFDKLVSIEMVEAVGHNYLDTYFRLCSRRLKTGGHFLLQAIVISDQNFEAHRRSTDFIQQNIFPGSALPSVSRILSSTARQSRLQLKRMEDIGLHYVRTLADWRLHFNQKLDEARSLGYGERFCRMWDYYLAYCEGGFRESYISDVQMLFKKL